MHRTIKSRIFFWLLLAFFVLYALSVIYPILWMMMNGFKNNQEFFANSWILPNQWKFSNFQVAWESGVGRYFFNSVFVTTVSVLLAVLISTLAAYAISRFQFKGRHVIFLIILSGLMMAPQASIVSLYQILKLFHLYNTYWGLIIPYAAFQIPFSVFLIRSYFLSIPRDVEEATFLDGGNSWKLLWSVIIPMSRPIIVSAALLATIVIWNEFMFAITFLENGNQWTIPVGILNLKGRLTAGFGMQLAALSMAALPMIIVFILFQRQFVRGLSAGSVKG